MDALWDSAGSRQAGDATNGSACAAAGTRLEPFRNPCAQNGIAAAAAPEGSRAAKRSYVQPSFRAGPEGGSPTVPGPRTQ